MSEWMSIDRWPQCRQMERPGIVFEVRNAAGQTMLTPCVASLPQPFDWTSPPVAFRVVEEQRPRHSEPLPRPRGPDRGAR